ncbi:MAG TPA: hypothetical protein VKE74_33755 [Gemmataceae bacterium]|nr:hypothetical protein [Gemmataceae bacterium]
MNHDAPPSDPMWSDLDDACHPFGCVSRNTGDQAVFRAVRAEPDSEDAWARLVVWLQDNGHDDEAEAVAAFWPAIADSVRLGSMTLGECLSLLARHAPALARLAGRLHV